MNNFEVDTDGRGEAEHAGQHDTWIKPEVIKLELETAQQTGIP